MSPEQLVEKIKSLGFIDASVIARIEKEIDNPESKTSVKGILAYPVKKGHLTKAQAKNMLDAVETPKPVVHEEITVTGQTPEYDTADLTANVVEVVPVPTQKKRDPDATVLDLGAADAAIEEVAEVVAVESEMLEPSTHAMPTEIVHDPLGGYQDPLADPMTSGSSYDETTPSEPAKTLAGFKGKRNQSDQWQNKWVYIGFGILGTLIIVGSVLYLATSLVSAADKFKAAMDSFEKGANKDAISRFDAFIEDYPDHERTPVAKVVRVQALLADTFEAKNWDETIKRAENELPLLEKEANEDERINLARIRDDLAVMLPNSTLNIAQRALKQDTIEAMTKELEMASRAKALVDNPVYIPGSKRKQATLAKLLDEIDNTIAAGEGLIRKEADFDEALVEIQQLTEEQQTDKAFERYHKLIRQYGDLQARESLREAMLAVSQRERSLVKPLTVELDIANQARPTSTKSTIVLASKRGQPIESLVGEVLPVLVDGTVVGVDVGDGSVKWRHFVGYQTTIQPRVFSPDSMLIADQANSDLLLVNSDTGTVIWRAQLGEDFNPPTVNEKQIVVTTVTGKVLNLDSGTGQVLNGAQLPQNQTSVNATFSQRNPYLYQPGYHSNLYVLSADDMTCQDVFYLGHYQGSINVPPVFWNGYILVAVNGSDTCDLHILKPTEDGLNLQPVQRMRRVTTGPVHSPMIRFGRWMLIAADNGDMKILELNTANQSNPFSTLAEDKFESRNGARAFLLADGSQLWIGGKGIMRYKIQRALGQFNRELILNHGDYFLGPMQKYGDALVHVRRRAGSELASVSAVNAIDLKPIWRTDIGGPLAGTPFRVGNELVAISSQGDLFSIDPTSNYSDNAVKSSTLDENLLFDRIIPFSDQFASCVGPAGRADILWVDIQNKTTTKLPLQKPADQAACHPVRLGDQLIVASRQGQVLRVNPQTGTIVGTPFLPPVTPGKETEWFEPVVVRNDRLVIGAGRGVFFLLNFEDARSIVREAELEVDGAVKSGCVAIGNSVYAVVGNDAADELVRLDSTNGLAAAGAFPLSASIAAGPWVVGDLIMMTLENDELVCVDGELNQKWSVNVPNDRFAAAPMSYGDQVALLFRSGKVFLVDPISGAVSNQFDLGQPINHQPLVEGGTAYFGGFDGTIHVTELPQ